MVEGPEKGRTITIKINGKQRSYEENLVEEKHIEDIKIESLREENRTEKWDDLSFKESAAAKETTEDDSFDWILPEDAIEPDLREYNIATKTKTVNKKGIRTFGQSFKKNGHKGFLTSIFITVFFAILLGTGFGFIMLKLVITENSAEIEQPVTAEPAVEEDIKQPADTETGVLQPLSTFVIQGGVFSNIEAARQIEEDHIQKGIPSKVIEINGQAVLYLSVSSSIEDAKEIGNQFKDKGYEAFAKPVTLEEKSLEGLLPEEKKVIDAAPAIYQAIAEGASEAARTHTLSDAIIDKIAAQMESIKSIKEDQLKNKGILSLNNELTHAHQQLLAYKESKDITALTKVQQHLLEFLSVYQSM
ncbi:SPOR domain-containing protein [Bacillus sp. DTU_2020_1000418_1_SI_GHA_SEK_038]|uniref:SPOR domain-containing protein n=1 Tax=Bacillus sp. DTU_2020_1000418_1_SI_GHA_SEK_038 TaxID=3077585 RepID=UPI0028E8A40A|nr:SPOR domain-containing protein [Bacillus sp. DTU_2020_1000418_1_SI_GHA_SEK_038]WNS74460.1 SPOR domain-containing protein [Bacillus sp. DTU_2020_1000418_1_SI_GHA_SEK_038]